MTQVLPRRGPGMAQMVIRRTHTARHGFGPKPVQLVFVVDKVEPRNHIFNIPTKRIYAIKYIYYYQHSPTCFGLQCAIFRKEFIVCLILLLHCLVTYLKLYYTRVYRFIYSYLKKHVWFNVFYFNVYVLWC